jgi:transcriptional regulator with XRE-family HTH domain
MSDQESQARGTSSELASFGEDLRREREIRGISLKEIADATKISKRFLEAIERNDHHTLPAPVFTRGFVREYARYVGLNSEEMVNRYNFAAASDDRIEKPPQVEKYATVPPKDITPKPQPKRGIPPPYARVNRNAITMVVLASLLAVVAWWAVQQKRRYLDAEPVNAVPITTRKAPVRVPPTTPAAPGAEDDTLLRLSVEVIGDSWVSLDADGKSVLNDELKLGDKRTFEASDEFRFRTIGNAAGLRLMLNGSPIPAMGGDGDVIKNRIFNRQSLEELRGETTVAAVPSTTS